MRQCDDGSHADAAEHVATSRAIATKISMLPWDISDFGESEEECALPIKTPSSSVGDDDAALDTKVTR